jgi:hypothetical protein
MTIREQIETIVRNTLENYLSSNSFMVGYMIPVSDAAGLVRALTNELCEQVIFPELDFERVITEALLSPKGLRAQSKQELGEIVAQKLREMMTG